MNLDHEPKSLNRKRHTHTIHTYPIEYYDFSQISGAGAIFLTSQFEPLRDGVRSLPNQPAILPLWANFNVNTSSLVYYRISKDAVTLQEVARMIYNVNIEFVLFQPTLAVIVTWFQVQLPANNSSKVRHVINC